MTEKQCNRIPRLIENHTGSMGITENAARVGCSVVTARSALMRYMFHHQWGFKPPETLDELRIALIVQRKPALMMDPQLILTMVGEREDDVDSQAWIYLRQIKDSIAPPRRGKRAK